MNSFTLPVQVEAAIAWFGAVGEEMSIHPGFVATTAIERVDQELLLQRVQDLRISTLGHRDPISCPKERLAKELTEQRGACAEQVALALFMFARAAREPSRVSWLSYTLTYDGLRLDVENSQYYLYFTGRDSNVKLTEIEDRTPD
jgi:hypothetical protein